MAIKWFDNFKMDNTGGPITPTNWSTVDGFNNTAGNTYTNVGLSTGGLDLSVNGLTSANNYAYKTGFNADGSGYFCFGFRVDNYGSAFSEFRISLGSFQSGVSTGNGQDFSPNGLYYAVAGTSAPNLKIYKRSVDSWAALADPASVPPNDANGIAFSPDSTYLAVAHLTSPYITIYKRSGDTFTKLSNPATLPTGQGNGVAFSPNGEFLAVAHSTSPFVTIYQRSGDTFTKVSNPATLPASTANGVEWSADSSRLGVAHATSPFMTIYTRSGTTFTKMSNPATLPPGTGNGISFSPDDKFLALGGSGAPQMYFYRFNGSAYTFISGTYLSGSAFETEFSPDYAYVSVGNAIDWYIANFRINDETISQMSAPSTLPVSAGGGGARYSPDGRIVAISQTNGWITRYNTGINMIGGITPETIASNISSDTMHYSKLYIRRTPYDIMLCLYKGDDYSKFGTPYRIQTGDLTDGYLEIELTGTTANLYLNDVLVSTLTDPYIQDLLNESNLTVFLKRNFYQTAAAEVQCKYTDAYVLNGSGNVNTTRLGPVIVDSIYPSTDTVQQDWSKSGGATFVENINENPVNESNYMYSLTNNLNTSLFEVNTSGISNTTTIASSVSAYLKSIYPTTDNIYVGTMETTPQTSTKKVDFITQKDESYAVYPLTGSPYLSIQKRSGDTFTPISIPGDLPSSAINSAKFSSDNLYLALAHNTAPYVSIYKNLNGEFIKLNDPNILPSASTHDITFSPDTKYMAVSSSDSTKVYIYERTGDTFTKVSDPSTLPVGNSFGLSFSPDGLYLSVTHSQSPYVTIYEVDGGTFTKLNDPTNLPTGAGRQVSFSPNSTYMAIAHHTSPYITIYEINAGVFTKITDPAILPTGNGNWVDFSFDGNYLAVTHNSSPRLTVYDIDGGAFTKLNDPVSLPSTTCLASAFSNNSYHINVAVSGSSDSLVYDIDGGVITPLADITSIGTYNSVSYNKNMFVPYIQVNYKKNQ